MRYAAGSLIALLVLSASATAAFAACKDTEMPEIRYTDESRTQTHIVCVARSERETATPAAPSSATKQPPSEAAPANLNADPFTGTYEGSWFDVSGTKGWRVPTKIEFRSVTPTSVSILYTQLRGFGGKGAESVNPSGVMARDLPRDGNSFSRLLLNGKTVVFTAEDDGSIRMERFDEDGSSGDVIYTGRLWRVPERTPDIPAQLAPLKGVWSGRAWSFRHTMEIDVFSEGPHFVVAVDYQYSPIGGWGLTGGGGTFIEHLGPEDPPSMRLFKTTDVVLQNKNRLLIEYQVRTARHSVTLKKEEPVSE